MPDRTDVINEANHLIQEVRNNKPMQDVLADYVAYLTENPEIGQNPELSHTMSTALRSILPDLIVEDIHESKEGGLSATETHDELVAMAESGSPYAEFAKLLLNDQYILQQAGVLNSNDTFIAGDTSFNLSLLRIDELSHKLVAGDSTVLTQELLSDGTGIWRDAASNIVAAQFTNGMIVHLRGNTSATISSKEDLFNPDLTQTLVPTQIDYPNGAMVLQDPSSNQWSYVNFDTNQNYPTEDVSWQSSYFRTVHEDSSSPQRQSTNSGQVDTYVVPINTQSSDGTKTEATFDASGRLVAFSRKGQDPNQVIQIDGTAGHQYVQLPGKPAYQQTGPGQWRVLGPDGVWKPVTEHDIPSITPMNGYLDVTLGPDPGGIDRGAYDTNPGGMHVTFFPNGDNEDADYERSFANNVHISNLKGSVSNLNENGFVAVSPDSIVILPDRTTVQQTSDGMWGHYSRSTDQSHPLARGKFLGLVSQPYYEVHSEPRQPTVCFASDNPDAPLVAITFAPQTGRYKMQVNGVLETFNFGGKIFQVERRDGSVIQFSQDTAVPYPVSIDFRKLGTTPGVNTHPVTYDESSPTLWTRDGKPVTVEGIEDGSDYSSITITDENGNQDIFPGGGLAPQHRDSLPEAQDTSQANSVPAEISLGRSKIRLRDGVPISVTVDDSELSNMLITPMLSANGKSLTIAIPPPASSDFNVVVSADLSTITVTNKKTGEIERFSAQGVEQFNS